MQSIATSLFLLFLLASCGTSEENRYRDTTTLELPPSLQQDRRAARQEIHDDSALAEEKVNKGLGNTVRMTPTEPPQLSIQQPFDIAWSTLEAALKQSEIEINDRELDKGLYYVTFDPDDYVSDDASFFSGLGTLFANDYNPEPYVLTVTADGSETLISAAKANQSERSGLTEAKDSDRPEDGDKTDGPDKLLRTLFKTIRDELVEN